MLLLQSSKKVASLSPCHPLTAPVTERRLGLPQSVGGSTYPPTSIQPTARTSLGKLPSVTRRQIVLRDSPVRACTPGSCRMRAGRCISCSVALVTALSILSLETRLDDHKREPLETHRFRGAP